MASKDHIQLRKNAGKCFIKVLTISINLREKEIGTLIVPERDGKASTGMSIDFVHHLIFY
jgi:hypothetical protein